MRENHKCEPCPHLPGLTSSVETFGNRYVFYSTFSCASSRHPSNSMTAGPPSSLPLYMAVDANIRAHNIMVDVRGGYTSVIRDCHRPLILVALEPDNEINAMAADDLAPCVARPSTAMALSKQVLQLRKISTTCTISVLRNDDRKCKYNFMFPGNNWAQQGVSEWLNLRAFPGTSVSKCW